MKKQTKLAFILSGFVILLIIFFYWLSGFNFDQRGQTALSCASLCSVFGLGVWGLTFLYPGDLT